MAASTLGAGRELHTSVSGRSYHNVVCLSINSSQISRRSLRRLRKAQVCCSALVLSVHGSNSGSFEEQEQRPQTFERFSYLDNPERQEPTQQPEKEKPLVRVQLSVHYRVHSRQMLCIGGSQIPFGWSFLSIAKVPMTWNQGDIWTCEDWIKLENEDAEGLVEVTYRTGSEPGKPPDVQVIQKQMAIVAWQPGPNRIVQVPTENELQSLRPGEVVERVPARPNQRVSYETELRPRKPDPYEGTWEILTINQDGTAFLDRHDVWGWNPSSNRPPGMRNFRFDNQ
eukprot:jgi/Chrzof1/1291/Cz10g01130.t1